MALKKVPLYQKPLSYVTVDPEATKGAVVGVSLYAQNGAVILLEDILNPAPTEPGLEFTYWRLIMEIPPNVVALAETATTGLYAITAAGTSATREIQPTVGRTTVSNGNGVAGDPVIDLAVVVDSGVGAALMKRTIDSFGRVTGSESATTDDLTEGASNLYFTDARADARITLQKGQPLGLATLDAGGKLDTGQLPALAITEAFVVASQVAMLALTAEEGDVAVRTDLSKSFILTAAPASTLGNWQELLTPMSPVTSVFGRVGSVTAASGDYTAAQVGADPVGSAAAAQSAAQTYADGKVIDSIADSDTTHAPSRNAVFDALSLKFDKAGGAIAGDTTIGSLLYADAINGRLGVGAAPTTFTFEVLGSVAGVGIARSGGGEAFILVTDDFAGANGGQMRGIVGSPGVRWTNRSSSTEWGRWDGPDFKINGGRLYGTALHNNASALTGTTNQYVGSGTYSPTITRVSNVDSATLVGVAQWLRVGNVVTVSLTVQIDVTAAGTSSTVGISFPIASAITSFSQCNGVGASGSAAALCGAITADATNDRAQMIWISGASTAALNWVLHFTYLIV